MFNEFEYTNASIAKAHNTIKNKILNRMHQKEFLNEFDLIIKILLIHSVTIDEELIFSENIFYIYENLVHRLDTITIEKIINDIQCDRFLTFKDFEKHFKIHIYNIAGYYLENTNN